MMPYTNLLSSFFDDFDIFETKNSVHPSTKKVVYVDLNSPSRPTVHSSEFTINLDENNNIVVSILATGVKKEELSISVDPSEKMLKVQSEKYEKYFWGRKNLNLSLNLSNFKNIDFSGDITAELNEGILKIVFPCSKNESPVISVKIS